jgi:hypothetical protein
LSSVLCAPWALLTSMSFRLLGLGQHRVGHSFKRIMEHCDLIGHWLWKLLPWRILLILSSERE